MYIDSQKGTSPGGRGGATPYLGRTGKYVEMGIFFNRYTPGFIQNLSEIVTKFSKIVKIIKNHQKTAKNCEKHANNHQKFVNNRDDSEK